jgi:thioredoxin reductase (NADPH)
LITSNDLAQTPLFAGVEEQERQRLARRAADIRLEPGEFLVREGEESRFFVILEGELEVTKYIVGQRRVFGHNKVGEFSGEIPIFMGTASPVSLLASTKSRVARFERQQLQELIQNSTSAGELIFSTMGARFSRIQQYIRETPSSRVSITCHKYDVNGRAIRSFLTAHRIPFEWHPVMDNPDCDLSVSIDGKEPIINPSVRQFAEAFGFPTVPKRDHYDVVIAGAGPAGMAAAVYGASEGLNVLLVERTAAGGQAGTSSRIENYLGFPAGISGDELTERAIKQAKHFGTHLVIKRDVEALELTDRGYCVKLDGGDLIAARAILLATGISWHRLEFEGHDQFLSRGIIYGASRMEANSIIGKRVFIIGGGNSAGQSAVFFSSYASEVVMLVRGAGLTSSMSQYLIQQIEDKTNIHVEPYTQVVSAHGENYLEQITTITRPPNEHESTVTRDARGLFIMIGAVAKTDWLPQSVECDSKGYICTGRDLTTWPLAGSSSAREPFPLETSIPGIFAAGDVRHNSVKRVASGVGEGSMAISFIHEYLALTKP